ncbi:MAG: hypothetical protein AAGE86_08515, partial [Pseudomonadota bacterium]
MTGYIALLALYDTALIYEVFVEDTWLVALSLAVDITLVYFLHIVMLQRGGLMERGAQGGFGKFLGMSLISGVAILFGLALLILPGLYLMIRWLPAAGFVLAEGRYPTDALANSWSATKEAVQPAMVALVVPFAMLLVPAAIIMADDLAIVLDTTSPFAELDNDTYYAGVLALYIVSTIGNTAIYVLGLALYSILRERPATLTDVF